MDQSWRKNKWNEYFLSQKSENKCKRQIDLHYVMECNRNENGRHRFFLRNNNLLTCPVLWRTLSNIIETIIMAAQTAETAHVGVCSRSLAPGASPPAIFVNRNLERNKIQKQIQNARKLRIPLDYNLWTLTCKKNSMVFWEFPRLIKIIILIIIHWPFPCFFSLFFLNGEFVMFIITQYFFARTPLFSARPLVIPRISRGCKNSIIYKENRKSN